LLICGIVSSVLYVGSDILAAMRWEGYSYASQSVSELMAIGAPTRPLLVAFFIPYNVLVTAFGMGVWASRGRKRALRVTGILLVAYGAVGLVGLFSPMHLRGAARSATDLMHIVFTGAIVLLILLYIGFGAGADGKWFRVYSIGTILTLVVFGGLAGMQGPRVAAQLPTPWLGVMERVNIYSSMLWVLVLAIVLLRAEKRYDPITPTHD
jgi:amino acid transporter